MRPLDLHTSYLSRAVTDPSGIVADAREALRDVDYDTMIGQGLSGALIIPVLARELGKHWLIVRKPDDGTHSWLGFEGRLGRRWIFVDDLVDTGSTRSRVRKVVADISDAHSYETTYVGDYLYQSAVAQPRGFTSRGATSRR